MDFDIENINFINSTFFSFSSINNNNNNNNLNINICIDSFGIDNPDFILDCVNNKIPSCKYYYYYYYYYYFIILLLLL
jgi:hypothetical protein